MPSAPPHRPPGHTPIGNAGWLLLPRGLRLFTGFAVGVWVARHLGPEQVGLLAFAMALAGLFAPFGKLGLDGFVVRDLIREPDARGEILGTALALKACASLVGAGACVVVAWLLRPGDVSILIATGLFSMHFVLRCLEVFELRLRALSRTRPVGLAQSLGLLASAAAALACIATDAPVVWFALPFTLEAAVSVGTVAIARGRDGGADRFRWSARRATRSLRESWPLLLSSLLGLVALQVDQVMIGAMRDEADLGQYSAAVRISSVLYVVPLVASQATQPLIVEARERGLDAYHTELQTLFTLLVTVAYLFALPVSLLSGFLILQLYGAPFAEAAPVLAIHAFAGPFVAAGAPRGLWVTNESLARHALMANLISAASNVALNLMLIPLEGIRGAAYATVLSYALGNLVATALFPSGQPILRMQLRALMLLDLPASLRRVAGWRRGSAA